MENIDIYKQLLSKKDFKEVDSSFASYCKYIKEKNNNLSNQITLENFCKQLNDNKRVLIQSLDNIKTKYIYRSDIHGIDHNIRVSMYGFYIGLNENLNMKDMQILLEACKYHDIGRVNDIEDKSHGKRSADLIKGFENLPYEDMQILLSMVTYHSVDDRLFDKIANMYDVNDLERLKILCNILKDSDALDRVRGGLTWGLDTKYLRTNISKDMVYLSYEFLYNYEEIKKKTKTYK